MKIGILTYHRTNNYGACLQAVATRLVLEQMGHEAYYVDYWPKYHENSYKVFSLANLKSKNLNGKIAYLLGAFNGIKEKKERIYNFNIFLEKYITPYCKPISEHFDVVLYGSDQIWRKQSTLNAYNPVYFGVNKSFAEKHVAFAASMGILPETAADREQVKWLVSNLDHIAVREDNLKQLLESLGYANVKRVLDPTLLLSSEEWSKSLEIESPKCTPYVLVYYVSKSAFDMSAIREFAKSKGMEVKILCGRANNSKDKNMMSTAGPKQFLSLFKNASYTFVTSFHGLAFSLIFEREFYTSFFNNSDRAKTLLNILGLESRLFPPKSQLVEQIPIDYTRLRGRMQVARIESIDILKSFL